tara:strand:- start:1287 stop:2528 length:1242 start_codon:yes stop_codon:yes gene_type:complete
MDINSDYTKITNCRISNSKNIKNIIDLGNHPLANSLKKNSSQFEKKFPLSLSFCNESSLLQLNETINKEILFEKYLWVTGTSNAAKIYAEKFVNRVIENTNLKKNDFILEIASNDGCILEKFIKKGYNNILGVDPAKNLAEAANDKGIRTFPEFWNSQIAEQITKDLQNAKVIIARNVIPHVSDILDVIKGINICLEDNGIGIIEFHNASTIQQELHYDSIYHEHLCYFSLKSLSYLLNKFNLFPFNVEKSPISGGSLVIYFKKIKNEVTKNLREMILYEENIKINEYETWKNFAKKTEEHKNKTLDLVKNLNNKKIIGYGSSARSQTYLNYCGIDSNTIYSIIDNNEFKHNLFTPGSSIPIVSFDEGMSLNPEIIFILAWNFKDEIIKQCLNYGYKGLFLLPFPNELKLVKI